MPSMKKVEKTYKTNGLLHKYFVEIGARGGKIGGLKNKKKGSKYFKSLARKRWAKPSEASSET